MNVFLIVLVSIVSLIVATILFYFCSSRIIFNIALKRDNISAKIIQNYTYRNIKKYKLDFSWWNNLYIKKIKIKSFDNLDLHARFIENGNKKIAIVVHGYGARSVEMQQYAKLFYDLGYSVLCPDNRGHGDSDGKYITMGYYDKFDVLSWIKYLNVNYKNIEIVVFGLSMGGATVCMLSGLSLPENVKAIIADCPYSNANEVLNNIEKYSILFHIFPIMKMFNLYAQKRAKFMPKKADSIEGVKNTKTPILFIHGDKDNFVPFYMHKKIYDATDKKYRDSFVVHNAGHAESILLDYEGYKKKVDSFLKKYVEK